MIKIIKFPLLILCATALALSGCETIGNLTGTGIAGVEPGNDAILVTAEKTTEVSYYAIDAFLKLDGDNRAFVKAKAPEVHAFAETLRRRGPDGMSQARRWLTSARSMTETYRINRTAENRANLSTALAVLNGAIDQAKQYTLQIQGIKN